MTFLSLNQEIKVCTPFKKMFQKLNIVNLLLETVEKPINKKTALQDAVS